MTHTEFLKLNSPERGEREVRKKRRRIVEAEP
jgi:hypothetical protein